nr:MAG TPA: minor structural protein [Caudoviricetes sp.]
MTLEELISLGLEKEQAEKVLNKYENMIPKNRFDEVNNKYNTANAELKDYKEKYTKLENDFSTYKAENKSEVNKLKLENLIDVELLKNGARDTISIKPHLDMAKISEDNNNLKEQIKTLKENKSYLFVDNNLNGAEPKGKPNTEEPKVVSLENAISNFYNKGE